jgi:PAS domain S-box-containing protein
LAEQQQIASLLDKRVQELNCLNDLGREIAETPAISYLLQWVTERIPPAMQYPKLCLVAVEYNGQIYGKPEAIEMPTQIVNALRVGGEITGRVYIAYSERHDFLDEESALLGGIATRLSGYIESRRFLAEIERLASIVENHPDFIGSSTLDGKALYVNPAGLRMMGMPADYDVTSITVSDFYPAEDAQLLLEKAIPAALKEGSWSAEAHLHTVAGVTIPVEETVGINYNADGQPVGFSITMRDITERKQVEEALRLSEERHRALLNAIPDLIIRLNKDGIYLDIKAAKDFSALAPPSELIGKNMYEILPPNLAQQRRKHIEKALQTGEVQLYEHQLMRDGQESYEETRVVPSGEGETLMIIRDITERKQAEAILRENQGRLAEALEIAKLANWEFDVVSQTLSLDDRFYALLRTTAEQEAGHVMPLTKFIQKFVHPNDAPLITARIEAATETDDPNYTDQFEYRIIRADGKEGHLVAQVKTEKDSQGKIINIAGIIQDITERKQAEIEREQLLAEVQAAYHHYVQREWAQFLNEHYTGSWQVEHQQIESGKDPAGLNISGNGNQGATLATPISLRGQTIGSLSLEDIDPNRKWTAEEIALIETVSEQLALTVENLRLFGDTQQQAAREQLTREITDKMRTSPDIDMIIETGLTELARALDVPRTYVKLTPKPEQIKMTKDNIEQARFRLKQYGHKK